MHELSLVELVERRSVFYEPLRRASRTHPWFNLWKCRQDKCRRRIEQPAKVQNEYHVKSTACPPRSAISVVTLRCTFLPHYTTWPYCFVESISRYWLGYVMRRKWEYRTNILYINMTTTISFDNMFLVKRINLNMSNLFSIRANSIYN